MAQRGEPLPRDENKWRLVRLGIAAVALEAGASRNAGGKKKKKGEAESGSGYVARNVPEKDTVCFSTYAAVRARSLSQTLDGEKRRG